MKDMHAGHRQRLRDTFLESGLDAFSDFTILELILFYSIPREDTNPIAHRLIDKFGSLSAVFDANYKELIKVEGVGKNTAILLNLIPQISRAYLNDKNTKGLVLDSVEKTAAYLLPKFIGRTNEVVFQLCLDNKSKVISCNMLFEGSVNATQIIVRKVVETSVVNNAVSVIIAHNHPNGVAVPSSEDIISTKKIKDALSLVSVKLVDHIIIADDDYISLSQNINRLSFI